MGVMPFEPHQILCIMKISIIRNDFYFIKENFDSESCHTPTPTVVPTFRVSGFFVSCSGKAKNGPILTILMKPGF